MRAPDWERGNVRLYCGDCLELLPQLEAGSVDAVVTDPPYGISATTMTLGKGKKEFHRGSWDQSRPDIGLVVSVGRLHCIWGGNYFTDVLPPTNDWLVWHKKNDDRSFSECELAWTDYGKQTRHLSHHWGGEEKQHPTQKPVAVIEWCLSFVPSESIVLDPFMGSGTTGVACVKTGRAFIGMEIEPKYFEIAVKRIDAAFDQFALLAPVPAAKQMELLAPEGKP